MNKHNQLTVEQFTRQAVPFSKSEGHLDDKSLQHLIEAVDLTGEDIVLDVACGTGIVACAFAPIAKSVTGIDLTPAMLEQARQLAMRRGLTNVNWQHGNIESLPFPDNSFSVVVSRYAFHHFLDPGAVLAEMTRVCEPGGRVLIVDGTPAPEKADAYNNFERLFDPSHNRALTLDEFKKLFAEADLQNVQISGYTMEMELEHHLAASFPNQGDDEKLRRLFREDIGVNDLGVNVRLEGDEIHYQYPVSVIVGEKA